MVFKKRSTQQTKVDIPSLYSEWKETKTRASNLFKELRENCPHENLKLHFHSGTQFAWTASLTAITCTVCGKEFGLNEINIIATPRRF